MLNKIDIPGTSITLEIVDKNITITNKIEYDMQMHFRNTDADASLDTSGDVFEPLYWLDIRVTPKTPTEYHTSLGVKREKRHCFSGGRKAHILCHIKNNRRFPHRRACRDNNQIPFLETVCKRV